MKKILIIIFSFYLIGCSGIQKNRDISNNLWIDSKNLIFQINKLKIGDIIVKNKKISEPITWFGHVAIVSSEKDITEYPMIGAGFIKCNIITWLNEERKVSIMRYKYFNEKFKKVFLETIEKNQNKTYRLFTDKMNEKYFYCSSYVWQMYYKTAKKLNDKNFDYNFGKNNFFIYPYDFLELPNFQNITFMFKDFNDIY